MNLKKQGGYIVLDLIYGLPTTRIKVADKPVKNLVIKAVGNMSEDNKTTTLNFEKKSGVLLHPNYWLAGVDYEDKMGIKAKIQTIMNIIHTNITSNNMKGYMQKKIINKA